MPNVHLTQPDHDARSTWSWVQHMRCAESRHLFPSLLAKVQHRSSSRHYLHGNRRALHHLDTCCTEHMSIATQLCSGTIQRQEQHVAVPFTCRAYTRQKQYAMACKGPACTKHYKWHGNIHIRCLMAAQVLVRSGHHQTL